MTKRLLKLQKRRVARAKLNPKLSEPDLRTPEEIQAARDAARHNNTHPLFSPSGKSNA
jgi:hypothetical protein